MSTERQLPTPGPWFVSGVRFKMNGGEWHSINRYDESKRQDENIACVGYDPRTGAGFADAHLIAAAPEMLKALKALRESFVVAGGMPLDDGEALRLIDDTLALAEGRTPSST